MFEELKKYSNNVKCIYYKKSNFKLIKKKLSSWTGEYIFSFRSHFIFSEEFIKKAKIAAINFHPGPPKYRGIGCVNFALLNNEKNYGLTCHLISKKIDKGKILNVKQFKIYSKDSVQSVLEKTYKYQLIQFKFLLKKLNQNILNIKKMIINSKNERWSSKLYKKKDLNELYKINNGLFFKKINIERYLKATLTAEYTPYIEIKKKRFHLNYEE